MARDYLRLAVEVATKAHEGQTDKGGRPYILHPKTVAEALELTEHKIIAYLHDVCEDTPITPDDLRSMGFSERIVVAIDTLTRRNGQSYEEYIENIRKNEDARLVKLADLRHNMDISRIPNPTQRDYQRVEKYKRALEILSA